MPELFILFLLAVYKVIIVYFGFMILFLCPSLVVYQEFLLWNNETALKPLSLLGLIKVYCLAVLWMTLCLIGSVLLLPKYALTRDVSYETQCIVEPCITRFCAWLLLGKTRIIDIHKLPPPNDRLESNVLIRKEQPNDQHQEKNGYIYVANHSSMIDTMVVYHLSRRFKWWSKSSLKYIPGVGYIGILGKHILVDRFNKKNNKSALGRTPTDTTRKSQNTASNLFTQSSFFLKEGHSVFVFPEGTRRMESMPFKNGAFKIAVQNCIDVVPISIDIPRTNPWNGCYPFTRDEKVAATITVHNPIEVNKNTDLETLKAICHKTIFSVLPQNFNVEQGKVEEIYNKSVVNENKVHVQNNGKKQH